MKNSVTLNDLKKETIKALLKVGKSIKVNTNLPSIKGEEKYPTVGIYPHKPLERNIDFTKL